MELDRMNLLVQFPTRERPTRMADAWRAMCAKATVVPRFHFILDDDDRSTSLWVKGTEGCAFDYIMGPRVSKIEACNRGLLDFPHPWDIVVLASDDMLCQVQGWDEIIRHDMATHFPDTDGCLWYPDGHQDRLCTLPVMGRKYFDRFGFIYHPSYKSLWADNEQHQVAEGMGKLWRSDKVLFRHMHPGWGTAKMDPLYQANNKHDKMDRENYECRKTKGFPA